MAMIPSMYNLFLLIILGSEKSLNRNFVPKLLLYSNISPLLICFILTEIFFVWGTENQSIDGSKAEGTT